jgi:hypothetical protein
MFVRQSSADPAGNPTSPVSQKGGYHGERLNVDALHNCAPPFLTS